MTEMWNKRPEEELPKTFTPPVAGGSPVRVAANSTEVKKENTTMNTTPIGKTENEPSRGSAVIGKAVKIVGEIYSNEDLLIEGFVEGTVEALDQKLTVGHNGTLHAGVQVRQLEVLGTVKGNVTAADRIEIRAGASLTGDLKAARIIIEDGAYFKGSIDIVKPEASMTHTPRLNSTSKTIVTDAALDMLVASR
jgi:cytoskeletal protein CcmA (bactofilin family)